VVEPGAKGGETMTNEQKISEIIDKIVIETSYDYIAAMKRELPKYVMPKMGYDKAYNIIIDEITYMFLKQDNETDPLEDIECANRILKALGYEKEEANG